jgi:hypothetical protein
VEPRDGTQILLTVDTEVYPLRERWRDERLAGDLERDIYGRTAHGEFGLRHQLEVLRRHGLKATFFVEPLFASCAAVGISPLRDIVQLVRSHGQEVQLHLHPEWVPEIPGGKVQDRGYKLTAYTEDEQCALLELAVENLLRAGSPAPSAFRAGDFAANDATLRALRRVGLTYDSSYNHAFIGSTCEIASTTPIWDTQLRPEGVWEVPVTTFRDYPGHLRHCQLCACSSRELAHVVDQASAARWRTVVLVSHSFELLANRRSARPVVPRRKVIERFERLCRDLAARKGSAPTAHFADLRPEGGEPAAPLRGSLRNTISRIVEQATARVASRLGR